MEPTEGRIPTPTAMAACREAAPAGEKSIRSSRNVGRDSEWFWAPMRVVM